MGDKKLVVYNLNSGKLFWFELFVLWGISWAAFAQHMHAAIAFVVAFITASICYGLYRTRYSFMLWTLISMAIWGVLAATVTHAVTKDPLWPWVIAGFAALIAFACHSMRREVDKDIEMKGDVY